MHFPLCYEDINYKFSKILLINRVELRSPLGGGRSIQLSYGNIFKIYSILVLNLLNVNRLCPKGGRYNIFLGGDCIIHYATRTFIQFLDKFANQKGKASLPLRRRLLYPLSYRSICVIICPKTAHRQGNGVRFALFLGGECSILLSYKDIKHVKITTCLF